MSAGDTGRTSSAAPPRSTRYRLSLFLLALTVLAAIVLLPEPDAMLRAGKEVPLTWHGKASLALLAAAIILWITEVVPFTVTALLVMLLIPVFGIESFKEVVSTGFGNQVITFMLGVLALSAAFTRSGLGERLGHLVLALVGTRTRMVILGFLVAGALLSMWITDMAVAAILMPLGVSVLRKAGVRPMASNFGKGLMISCAWGPLFGGIATPSGCAPNPLTVGFLRELANIEIDFVTWMSLGLPAAVLMVPAGWLVILAVFPPEIERLPVTPNSVRRELETRGPLAAAEKWTAAIFVLTVAAWIFSPTLAEATGGRVRLPIQAVALGGALLLFLPGIDALAWKQAQADVDWGGIVLICAGVALGMAVFNSGAARWLSWAIMEPVFRLPAVLRVFVIVLVVCVLHLAMSSNAVTGTVVIPLLIALAGDLGINPWIICAPAAFASSLAFILVTETPTNVIPYSAGYFAIKDMAVAGVIMTLVAALCVGLSILLVGSVVGSYTLVPDLGP